MMLYPGAEEKYRHISFLIDAFRESIKSGNFPSHKKMDQLLLEIEKLKEADADAARWLAVRAVSELLFGLGYGKAAKRFKKLLKVAYMD